jgi:hypothetical protein
MSGTSPTTDDADVIVVPADKDAITLVSAAMVPTELKLEANSLRAKKNPLGEGTFVYAPQTTYNGVERHVIWLVHNNTAYALTGAAKLATPKLDTATTATEAEWAKTGINKLNAEQDAVKIVFANE